MYSLFRPDSDLFTIADWTGVSAPVQAALLARRIMLISAPGEIWVRCGYLYARAIRFLRSPRELFAKANEEKSGDQLAGIAARSERERVAAKRELADLPLAEIVEQPLIDPDEDEVSRLILDTLRSRSISADQEPDRRRISRVHPRRRDRTKRN